MALVLAVCSFSMEGLASQKSNRKGTGFDAANVAELLSKPNAIGVKVGACFDNLHDLSLQNRRFVGEGFYWYEWPQRLQDKLDSNEMDPGSMISIANQLDTWDSDIQGLHDEPIRLLNGNYCKQSCFSAHLYVPMSNLKGFPS